jgi:hypothetical protein
MAKDIAKHVGNRLVVQGVSGPALASVSTSVSRICCSSHAHLTQLILSDAEYGDFVWVSCVGKLSGVGFSMNTFYYRSACTGVPDDLDLLYPVSTDWR